MSRLDFRIGVGRRRTLHVHKAYLSKCLGVVLDLVTAKDAFSV